MNSNMEPQLSLGGVAEFRMLCDAREAKSLRFQAGNQFVEPQIQRVFARPNAQVPEQDVAIANGFELLRDQLVRGNLSLASSSPENPAGDQPTCL